MGLVALVVACGIAAQSPILVSFGVQPDCSAPAIADVGRGSARNDDPVNRWATEIAAAANRFDVQPQWIRVIMQAESGGIPSAISPAGAMGLMQIMPDTWIALRQRYGLDADPYEPADNIMAGVAYMRELLDRYGTPDVLAAYNAGPGRLDDYLLAGRPLPDETRRYLETVGPELVPRLPLRALPGGALARPSGLRSRKLVADKGTKRSTASALFVQRASIPAAIVMHSKGSAGAADLIANSSGDGLFVSRYDQGSGS